MNNGLYELDLETPIYNINAKKFKSLTYLYHCCLSHINEKHISKLYKDGLLNPFDFQSYEVCESYLLGKMTKAPFIGHNEKASHLLGLIHSDICGPLNIHAREGFLYFIY